MTPLPPTQRFNRILEEGLCIGCGLCQSVAGSDAIRVVPNGQGGLRPKVVKPLDDMTVDAIYQTCPGTRLESLPLHLRDEDGAEDVVWGPYATIQRAHAADPEVRFRGATGGVLSALAIYLLECGQVDYVIHAKGSASHPSFGERHVSRTRADVLRGAGSRYGPTATLIDIHHWLARGKPFAFIGTPCDVSALRNLALQDDRVDELCRFMLAPVCGGFMETPALKSRMDDLGVDFHELKRVDYRGNGCPGPTRMEEQNGSVTEKSYLDFWGDDDSAWSLPWRCKICADGIGEAADIAASDVWPGGAPTPAQANDHSLDPGSNGVIARSTRGRQLLNDAVAEGALIIDEHATTDDLSRWQPHQVAKKRLVGARHNALSTADRLVPITQRLRVTQLHDLNDATVNDAETAGTLRRIKAGVATETVD